MYHLFCLVQETKEAGRMETAIYFVLYEKLKKQEEKMLEVDQLHPMHFIYIAAVCTNLLSI